MTALGLTSAPPTRPILRHSRSSAAESSLVTRTLSTSFLSLSITRSTVRETSRVGNVYFFFDEAETNDLGSAFPNFRAQKGTFPA